MGLAPEQQPTYAFNAPGGLQGFNGGVQLLNVRGMAASAAYRSSLSTFEWARVDARWRPAVDLGDQTLYSALNFTQPGLFHTLSCVWNRQMCRVWFSILPGRDRTSKAELLSHEERGLCPAGVAQGAVRILHGNCKSNRPGSAELDGLPDAWQARNAAAEAEMLATYNRMKTMEESELQRWRG